MQHGLTTDKIDHSLFEVAENDKFSLLTDITVVENPDSCIIFCRTKDRVDMVCDQLTDLDYYVIKFMAVWFKMIDLM